MPCSPGATQTWRRPGSHALRRGHQAGTFVQYSSKAAVAGDFASRAQQVSAEAERCSEAVPVVAMEAAATGVAEVEEVEEAEEAVRVMAQPSSQAASLGLTRGSLLALRAQDLLAPVARLA